MARSGSTSAGTASARAAGAARSPRRPAARPAPEARELTLAEHACLALVAEGVGHGWAVGSVLAPEGEVGRVWSLSRPLTYRAIEQLVERRLVSRRSARPGHGRERSPLVATAAGRRAAEQWLDEPVAHLREVRTELLVKLELRRRAGLDAASLLEAQRAASDEQLAALGRAQSSGDLVDLWRAESARAVRRFLEQAVRPTPQPRSTDMRLSARNQLRATITAVVHGEVMSSVKAELGDGQSVTATITREAAEELDLAPGDPVVVIVKSTEVMLATPE
jgi:PadR family transcriptional regulator AphA